MMTDTEKLIGFLITIIALILTSMYFFVGHKDDLPGDEDFRDPTLDTPEEDETE